MSSRTLVTSIAAVLASLGVSPGAGAADLTGACVGVFAGDSVGVAVDGQTLVVRLAGVSCPPMDHELGLQAARHTYRLATGEELSVTALRRGAAARLLGTVRAGGRDLAVELLRAGLASHRWAERPDPLLAEAQRLARTEGLGLWSPTVGLVEIDLAPAAPPPPPPRQPRVAEISAGALTDRNVIQDDIVWVWSASAHAAGSEDRE